MAQLQALQEQFEGQLVIAGVDVLERLKGIPLKLLAFEKVLHLRMPARDCRAFGLLIALPNACAHP